MNKEHDQKLRDVGNFMKCSFCSRDLGIVYNTSQKQWLVTCISYDCVIERMKPLAPHRTRNQALK